MVELGKALVVDVPGDGSCLFHAIAHPILEPFNGHALREIVATIIENYPHELLHGVLLQDWIQWDSRKTCTEYALQIRKNMWGGALEMTILASVLNVKMFVYSHDRGKSKICSRVTDIYPDTEFVKRIRRPVRLRHGKSICLLWVNKSHYMNLTLL
jgi:hypothetical protein